jgi:hypothetical protein
MKRLHAQSLEKQKCFGLKIEFPMSGFLHIQEAESCVALVLYNLLRIRYKYFQPAQSRFSPGLLWLMGLAQSLHRAQRFCRIYKQLTLNKLAGLLRYASQKHHDIP